MVEQVLMHKVKLVMLHIHRLMHNQAAAVVVTQHTLGRKLSPI
jgi:hypothetical protein